MDRISDLREMLSERRVGFLVDEVMNGTHHFEEGAGPGGELLMEFRVTWGNKHLGRFLNPFGDEFFINSLKGKVTVGGLVEDADCEGRLELKYIPDAKIRYIFDFRGPRMKRYHFVGEKRDIRPWNLHRTHTTLYGTLAEVKTGRVISKSILYFRLNTMPVFLKSMRLG